MVRLIMSGSGDIEELQPYIDSDKETFVIGGAIIYRQLMTKVNKMYKIQTRRKKVIWNSIRNYQQQNINS